MPSIELLNAFTAAAFLMNISPGPSNLYVMARALAQGTQGGIVAAIYQIGCSDTNVRSRFKTTYRVQYCSLWVHISSGEIINSEP